MNNMESTLLGGITLLSLIFRIVHGQDGIEVKEYCEDETFSPSCNEGEVIMMTSARYGRMKLGKCIQTKYGDEGCQANAVTIMDRKCSGQPSCNVKVSDLVSEVDTPCKKDLRSYLDASYRCVPVVTASRKCVAGVPLQITASSGYLSNYIAGDSGCGYIEAPWSISVQQGQTINVTLYDFHPLPMAFEQNTCQVYAVIKDHGQSETICGRDARVTNVYRSISNQVDIRIVKPWTTDNPTAFLMHYEALGCPDLPVDSTTSFMRTNTGAEISCADKRRWTMTCVDSKWRGAYNNCSQDGQPHVENVVSKSFLALPYGVSVALMVGVALIIGVIILVIGLYIIRRRRDRQHRQGPGSLSQRIQKEKTDFYMHQGYPASDRPYCSANHSEGPYHPAPRGENTYYRTWDAHHHALPANVGAHGQVPGYPPYQPPSSADDEAERYVEHIYESPKSLRREFNREMLQYYELENDNVQQQQQQNALRHQLT